MSVGLLTYRSAVPKSGTGGKETCTLSCESSVTRTAVLSGIIIHKNLKLLPINYLARKVDFFFQFPSGSQYTCNGTYGKTWYTHKEFRHYGKIIRALASNQNAVLQDVCYPIDYAMDIMLANSTEQIAVYWLPRIKTSLVIHYLTDDKSLFCV